MIEFIIAFTISVIAWVLAAVVFCVLPGTAAGLVVILTVMSVLGVLLWLVRGYL